MSRLSQVPQFTAKWKNVGKDSFRAVCGNPKCPGALGLLFLLKCDRLDTSELEKSVQGFQHVQRQFEFIISERIKEGAEPNSAPILARREAVTVLQKRIDALVAYIESLKVAGAELESDEHRYVDALVMVPDRNIKDDPKTAPLYYGYPDTGYRISFRGKRTRDGFRVSRRPYEGGSNFSHVMQKHGLETAWRPGSQTPQPPCNIWCPVCGSLNSVPLPEAVVEHAEGTSH
jgi:hypothetical protein